MIGNKLNKLITCLSLVVSNTLSSQEKCASQQILNVDPVAIQYRVENIDSLLHYSKSVSSISSYSIPIVVHVLHDYGNENISDVQIINAINQLNLDFNSDNSDTNTVISEFKSNIGNASIRFVFARIDPNGNCTNGIDRIFDETTYNGYNTPNPWPQNRYLNFWIVNNIIGGASGYATFPFSSKPINEHGIVVQYNSFNTNSRTPTHEMGHFFGLYHIWDASNNCNTSCNGSDLVPDTPPTLGYFNCPSPLAVNNCSTTIRENYQNFMDYTNCGVMFTNGQINRMYSFATSTLGLRSSLSTSVTANLTGINLPMQTCSPIVDFTPNLNTTICAGDSIFYKDYSYGSNPTSWSWSFPGGSPSTSTLQNVWVKYTNAGTYNASLSALNSAGNSLLVKANIVSVLSSSTALSLPFFEGFESASTFTNTWSVMSKSNNQWFHCNFAASTGANCVALNNFTSNNNEVDGLVSPQFNFTNSINPKLIFSRAFVRKGTSNDKLSILFSVDCGKTWQPTGYSKTGINLATDNAMSSSFTASFTSQWDYDTLNLNPISSLNNVRFMFKFESDKGNNIFIDDINIINDISTISNKLENEIQAFTVFPNPANNELLVILNNSTINGNYLKICDVLGKTMYYQPIENKLNISLSYLSSGVYFISIDGNTKSKAIKLIIYH